jgi:hypothetical protein
LFLSLIINIHAQEVLRGEVWIDLEPVYALSADVPYPLDAESAYRRGLEEAAMVYGAMIYGWSFSYDIGELARGIPESFELTPVGTIVFGDPGLFVTEVEVRDMYLQLWTDYRPTETQLRRLSMWKAGSIRSAQAIGRGPLVGTGNWPSEATDWLAARKAVLEDAARTAVRAMLQGSERNRPREARGFISLSAFPAYWIDGGYWTASARFRVNITEVIPFAVY